MIRTVATGLALVLALAASSATQALQPLNLDLQSGGSGPLTTTKVQLGIKSPADCPGAGRLQAWVFTNKPGTVNIMLVERNSGNVTGPFPVTTVEGSGGAVLGSYKQNFMINSAMDREYRVVVVGSDLHSNWVPLTACL